MNQATVLDMAPDVAAAFDAFRPAQRDRLLALRRLVFATAAATPGVGRLTETLKWGEPAYLTQASRSGSTIRLGCPRAAPDRCAVYFNCKTTLIETFRTLFAAELDFDGNRAILLGLAGPLPERPLAACLAIAYHLGKRARMNPRAARAQKLTASASE